MKNRILKWSLLAANIAVFVLFFFIRNSVSVTGNVAMLFCLGVLAADLIYAAFVKNWLGFWFIPAQAGLVLTAYFARQAASSSHASLHSISTLNFIVMLAMPLLAVAFILLDLFGIGRKKIQLPASLRFLRWLLPPVLLVGLFTFALLGYDHVYNFGYSVHEYTTSRADFLFLAMIFVIACLFLRQFISSKQGSWGEYLKRSVAVLTIFTAVAGFGFASFLRGYTSLRSDIAAAEADYQAMFGQSSKEFSGRAVPLSIPQLFFGVRHRNNYRIERDVTFRTVTEGDFAGLTLAFDAYYPMYDAIDHPANDSHGVIIWLHGSGGDKGNRPHMCKYLASKGYVVYDLQMGDRNEKNTNFPEGLHRDWNLMLESIDAFFAFATEHESAYANFDSVFIIGASMGGFLATDYIYNFEHSYQDHGVNIRGIIPLYGNVGDAEIDENSVPVLIYTGSHDGYINVRDVRQLREKYRDAGNDNAMFLEVSFAGHGPDDHFSSRGGQLKLYFLERFLGQLR